MTFSAPAPSCSKCWPVGLQAHQALGLLPNSVSLIPSVHNQHYAPCFLVCLLKTLCILNPIPTLGSLANPHSYEAKYKGIASTLYFHHSHLQKTTFTASCSPASKDWVFPTPTSLTQTCHLPS